MDADLFYQIATVVLALVSIFSAVKYRQVKQLLKDISDALEDDQVTPEEASKIISSLLGLVGKSQ
uniref:Uncharacterized protein n=1 Tax=viral metagenome TaxID=1070528 RepID=A0A6M3KDI7_9ZZZZ